MVATGTLATETGKHSSRERRHDAILDAAETLFIEKGFAHVRLAEIVGRSGGSLQTKYELFGDKRGLLHAIAVRWRDEAMQARREYDASPTEPISEILMGYVRNEIAFWQSPRSVELMRMLVSEGLRDRGFARQIYRDLHLPFLEQVSAVFFEWTALAKRASTIPRRLRTSFFRQFRATSCATDFSASRKKWPMKIKFAGDCGHF